MYSPKISDKIVKKIYPIGKRLKRPLTKIVEDLLLDGLERVQIPILLDIEKPDLKDDEIPFWVKEELQSKLKRNADIPKYLLMWKKRFAVIRLNHEVPQEMAEQRALRDVFTAIMDRL